MYHEIEATLDFRRIYGAPCMTCTDDDCPGWRCEVLEPLLPPDIGEPPEQPEALQKYEVTCSLYKALWEVHWMIADREPDEFGSLYQQFKDYTGEDILGPYIITAIRFYGLWRVFGWREMKDKILVGYSSAAKDHLRQISSQLSEGMEM